MVKSRRIKGQVTMEFIVTIIMILLVFIFGVTIFQDRMDMNYTYTTTWVAKDVAYRVARDISNVDLFDSNAVIIDSIIWSGGAKRIAIEGNTVVVYEGPFQVGVPFVAKEVELLVSEPKGTVIFSKENGKVVVRNG
jgi:hypothetical protein